MCRDRLRPRRLCKHPSSGGALSANVRLPWNYPRADGDGVQEKTMRLSLQRGMGWGRSGSVERIRERMANKKACTCPIESRRTSGRKAVAGTADASEPRRYFGGFSETSKGPRRARNASIVLVAGPGAHRAARGACTGRAAVSCAALRRPWTTMRGRRCRRKRVCSRLRDGIEGSIQSR
jgi:hypothetical protein